MRKLLHTLLSLLIVCGLTVVPAFAQTEQDLAATTTLTDSDIRICPEYRVTVPGPLQVTTGKEQSYVLQSSIPGATIEEIVHEIWQGEDFLDSFVQGSFQYTFPEYGSYIMKTLITTSNGCTYVSQQTVQVYNNIFLYIGGGSDEFTMVSDTLQRSDILLSAITIPTDPLQGYGGVIERLVNNKGLIDNAESIILDSQSLGAVLGALPEVEKIIPLSLDDGNMIVLASINNSAFRRLIGTYSALGGFKEINVIPQNTLSALINGLLSGRTIDELGFIRQYSTELQGQSKIFFMSYFIDSLLLDGVPLQMIILLLLLPVFGLIVTFYRHVLGFATYGVYGSLLVGLSFFMIGWIPTLSFLFAGLLAVVFTNLLVKKVYVLSTAKQALVVSFYAFFLIILFVAQQQQTAVVFFPAEQFNNPLQIFLIMYLLIISNTLFKDTQKLFTKKRLFRIIQFAIVIFTVITLLGLDDLHNLLLGYPELALLITLTIFIVGRYTGLQVTEYLRFAPLISWTISDHEEEE